jgi:hypothetical protein
MEREAKLLQNATKLKEAHEMKVREFAAIRSIDSTIVVSTSELESLKPELQDCRLELLPLLLNTPGTKSTFQMRNGIVFVGGYQHAPNVDAVVYFVTEVMPFVRGLLPGVKFHVVGSKPPTELFALAADDVIVEGYIEDLNVFLDTMRIAVAPLRYGAGVKGKVGTAMAAGLPVVVTSIAAEGMGVIDGVHASITDESQHFAKYVADIYTDPAKWNSFSNNGLSFANCMFGPTASFQALRRILGNINFELREETRYRLSLYATQ